VPGPAFNAAAGRGNLPRFAAAAEHRRHQAEYVIHDTVLRGRQYVGGTPLLWARGFLVRLNRSFILFVKASSTVPA